MLPQILLNYLKFETKTILIILKIVNLTKNRYKLTKSGTKLRYQHLQF